MGFIKEIYNAAFGKNYEPIWREFAKEKNGTYLQGGEDKVAVVCKNHTILLDHYVHYTTVGSNTYQKEYTRGIVEFRSPDKLKLRLTSQDLVDNIGKLFGAQDILVGDKQFDKQFMIKGNDEYKIQLLFSDHSIKKLLSELKVVRLEITDGEGLFDEKVQEGNSMLYFLSEEKVKNVQQLNKIYQLFAELLDALKSTSSMQNKV